MTHLPPQTNQSGKQYWLLLSGLIICGYFIYIRIILQRLPKEIKPEWNCLRFTIYLGLLLLFLLLFLKKVTPPTNTSRLMVTLKDWLFDPLKHFYESSIMRVHDYLIDEGRLPIKTLIERMLTAIHKGINRLASNQVEPNYLIIYYSINLLPRILVLSGLTIDVFIFQKFEFAYKIMPILILPMLFNATCYILREFVDIQLQLIEYLVDVEIIDDGGEAQVVCSIKEGLTPEAEEQFSAELLTTLTQTAQKYISIQRNFLDQLGSESTIPELPVYHRSLALVYLLSAVIWGHLAMNMGYLHILTLINIHFHL